MARNGSFTSINSEGEFIPESMDQVPPRAGFVFTFVIVRASFPECLFFFFSSSDAGPAVYEQSRELCVWKLSLSGQPTGQVRHLSIVSMLVYTRREDV